MWIVEMIDFWEKDKKKKKNLEDSNSSGGSNEPQGVDIWKYVFGWNEKGQYESCFIPFYGCECLA